MSDEDYDKFILGRSFFTIPWVEAPSATTARDGLGPLLMQIVVLAVILLMEEEHLIKMGLNQELYYQKLSIKATASKNIKSF